MTEIWKDIEGYEGYYQVSNLGNFRSLDRVVKYKKSGTRVYPGKSMKVEPTNEGYTRIVLMKDGIKKRYMCHRIVAHMFVDNPDSKPYVNHINGITYDNRAENLEWCTQEENEKHSIEVLGKTMKGKTYPKQVMCVETKRVFKSMSECVRFIGNNSCIEGINKAMRANRKYHGYTLVRV